MEEFYESKAKLLNKVKSVAEHVSGNAGRAIQWVTVTVTSVTVVLFLAVFLYGTLYYNYIPQASLHQQMYFQRVDVTQERKRPDGTNMFVTKQRLEAQLLFSSDGVKFLNPGQPYRVWLELNMPDSEVNLEAGTFSVNTISYDKKGNVLTSSSRLVMLRYRSWLLRILDTLVYSPLYLTGFLEQAQNREIELYKYYRENTYKPTSMIVIEIDNQHLQVYDAHLNFQVQYTGLRYWMYYWPISSALFGVGLIGVILLIIFLSSWYTIHDSTSDNNKHFIDDNQIEMFGTGEIPGRQDAPNIHNQTVRKREGHMPEN